ncbi:MAG: HDOD domain-containing protein [Sideroxyarcus sp.]|nr:HDOD domain-containing protein [Sideroxyarcus sp.]
MLTSTSNTIAEELSEAMFRNDLVLPAMPAWAAKVMIMLDNIKNTAGKIAPVLTADPAFVAQLLKAANGTLYTRKPKVYSINASVARIGYEKLRNLVVSISMDNLSTIEAPALKKHLVEFWEHSREVAAICYVLAKSQKHLTQDEAMLAGLIHDIGRLPLLLYIADKNLPVDDKTVTTLVRKYSALAGARLLRTWGFPTELVEIPMASEHVDRETVNTRASYADVVTVANMLTRSNAKTINWESITAVKRLGLDTEFYRKFFVRYEKDLTTAREILA